jgi:uncharacterized membrane protein YbhN (UPF0104 family)
MTQKQKRPLRRYVERIGAAALVYTIWSGRDILLDSLIQIQRAELSYVVACFALAWCNFLWSGLGYTLLAKKSKLSQVVLVHIAASGPGRVIPGGAGHFSFGVLYLKKLRYTLEQALAVATINNGLGFLVNIALVVPVLIIRPEVVPQVTIGATQLYIVLGIVSVAALVFYKYRKNKAVRTRASKTKQALRITSMQLLAAPKTLVALVATMLSQIATHSCVLLLAGTALTVHIDPFYAFVAVSAGVAVGSLLPTPGGIGGVEAGIIASLVSFGLSTQDATSVALVYRAATYLQPLLPGTLSYLYLTRKKLL